MRVDRLNRLPYLIVGSSFNSSYRYRRQQAIFIVWQPWGNKRAALYIKINWVVHPFSSFIVLWRLILFICPALFMGRRRRCRIHHHLHRRDVLSLRNFLLFLWPNSASDGRTGGVLLWASSQVKVSRQMSTRYVSLRLFCISIICFFPLCYTEEATSTSYFCLFLLFLYDRIDSACVAGGSARNTNKS